MLSRKHIRGFSLVELMIASALGISVLSGLLILFTNTVKVHRENLKEAHLNQELQAIMAVMTMDIRRAGYWSQAQRSINGQTVNHFAEIHIIDDNCLLYSYDEDKNDTDGKPDPDDQGGYRLDKGKIRMKTSDKSCGGITCDRCSGGVWQTINDNNTITITGLSFNLNKHAVTLNSQGDSMISRQINISLTAALKNEPERIQTLTSTVHVRNDLLSSAL